MKIKFFFSIFLFEANLRTLRQYNEQGVKVSPRDEPPSVDTRFQAAAPSEPYLSPRQGNISNASPMMQAAAGKIYNLFISFEMKNANYHVNSCYKLLKKNIRM